MPGSSAPDADDDTETSLAVGVPLDRGEIVRRELLAAGVLRRDLDVRRRGDRLWLPVSEPVDDFDVDEVEFRVRRAGPSDYRDLLELPDDIQERLPSSFDRIGDLVAFKLPDDLEPYRAMVGEALLEFVAGSRTVALDRGVKGPHRVRDLEVVSGDDDLETVHREHNVELLVDPSKAYFSPRLATERRRVADQVADDEVLLDAFAGVGPFSIVAARHGDPRRVVAVEIHDPAYDYLVENVERNGVGDVVTPVHGDAGDELPERGPADRIVLNLPHEAAGYLDVAREALAPGGTVHLYEIVDHETVGDRLDELEDDGWTVVDHREVHHYSPQSGMYVFDLREAP